MQSILVVLKSVNTHPGFRLAQVSNTSHPVYIEKYVKGRPVQGSTVKDGQNHRNISENNPYSLLDFPC